MSTWKKTILSIVLILSLAMNIGVGVNLLYHRTVTKHFWARGPEFKKGAPKAPFYRDLNLTEEQEKKIAEFHKEMQKKITPLSKSLNKKRRELFEMVESGKIDEKKKQSLLQEISSLQMQIENISLDNMVKVRSVMTPQQLEKMNKSFGKIKPRFFDGDTFPGPHTQGPREFNR